MKRIFPDPKDWDDTGLIAITEGYDVDILLAAYREGVFPWPSNEIEVIPWFSPEPRGILEFNKLHLSKSFQKFMKKNLFVVTMNKAFEGVMRACAEAPRPGQSGTWIEPEMIPAYAELLRLGHALSFEAWDQGGVLVGGIYGVLTEKYFSAESMFFHSSNASKVCLLQAVQYLGGQGHSWMDVQMITDVSRAFGGEYVARRDFLARIS